MNTTKLNSPNTRGLEIYWKYVLFPWFFLSSIYIVLSSVNIFFLIPHIIIGILCYFQVNDAIKRIKLRQQTINKINQDYEFQEIMYFNFAEKEKEE